MKERFAKILRYCLLLGVSTSLASAPALADSYESNNNGPAPSAEAMAADLIFIRPASLVATVLGTGFFVVSLPFSILGGNVDEAGQNLVLKPAKTTFIRPLGEFD
jgi:hypothetical protein